MAAVDGAMELILASRCWCRRSIAPAHRCKRSKPARVSVGSLICVIAAALGAIALSPAAPFMHTAQFRSPFLADRREHSRLTASALNRKSSTAPPLELFDGLDDIEEECEEEEPEEKEEPATEAPSIHSIVPKGGLGSGILELQKLQLLNSKTGKELEIDEEALAELHAALAKEAPKCPSADTVAWMVHALEDLAIEEDEILEVLAKILTERADELGPQSLLNVITSYGNVYWADGDDLLDAMAKAVRRQLADFTTSEVVKLCNGLIRMGGIDDTRNAGLFFEMRQRVNLPHIEEFIKEALNKEAQVYKQPSESTLLAMRALENMPNKRLKAKAEKMLQYDLETRMPKLLERSQSEDLLHDGWEAVSGDEIRILTSTPSDVAGDSEEEEDSGPPEIRFQDLAAASPTQ